jgi:hypothetical protein
MLGLVGSAVQANLQFAQAMLRLADPRAFAEVQGRALQRSVEALRPRSGRD